MSKECPICCEAFTASLRKTVECPACQNVACAACAQTYILSITGDAECMSCHHLYDREFLGKVFTKAFLNTKYRQHRENVLLEREMAMLPATQQAVQNFKLSQELQQQIRETNHLINEMTKTISTMKEERYRKNAQLRRILASEYESDGLAYGRHQRDETVEKKTFIRACSQPECRGFLNGQWKCGTCESYTCQECHEPLGLEKNVDHTCDPEKIATARLLRRDSKPCPKCCTLIYKIDGCDQIWCTQCHTAFSWRTGRIELGHIHNPHYYAWLRSQSPTGEIPRHPGDGGGGGGCGNVEWATAWHVDNALKSQGHPPGTEVYSTIMYFHRQTRHIQAVELPRVPRVEHLELENKDLRIKYLLKGIDRDGWKRALVLREKSRARQTELRQVFEMFITVCSEILRAFIQKEKNAAVTVQELVAITRHANEAFLSIARRYSCSRRFITIPEFQRPG